MFDLVLKGIIVATFAVIAIGGVWIVVQTLRRWIEFRKPPQGRERHSAGGSDDHDSGAAGFSSE